MTLCPTFLDDDSPETLAAGYTLGIQHPPGYPLTALLIRLAGFIPLGNACFRVNFVSALLASLSIFFLFRCMVRLLEYLQPKTGPTVPPLGATGACFITAALLAFSKTFWEKAVGAKGLLYIAESTILILIFLCLVRSSSRPDHSLREKRWALLAVFLTAVGLGIHWETQVVFIPALFFFLVPVNARVFLSPKKLLLGSCLCLLGFSPLLYLPLRAHLHPILDLGQPDTYPNFMAALLRKYTAFREIGLLETLGKVLLGKTSWVVFTGLVHRINDLQASRIGPHLIEQMKPLTLLFAGVGLGSWWRSGERRLIGALLLPMALLFAALCAASWIPPGPLAAWYVDNFLMPAHWCVAILTVVGFSRLLNPILGLSLSPLKKGLLWAAFISTPLLMIFQGLTHLDQSRQMLRYDYGVNLMRSLPARGIFFAEGDEDYFPFYYLQEVERRRPDLKMLPSFTLFETWGVEQVERRYPDLGLTASKQNFPDHFARILYSTSEIIEKNKDKTSCAFSYFDGAFHRYYLSLHPNLPLQPSGIVLELNSPLTRKSPGPPLSSLRVRHLDSPSNDHPSLVGIRQVYQKVGYLP